MSEDDESIAVWCKGEEWCTMTATASLICKKWHPVIIHRLINEGSMGFNALKNEIDGISSKVLSDSLEDLEEKKLVEREIVSEKPFRVKYSLTQRGEELEPVINAMKEWGDKHIMPAKDQESSLV